MENVGKNNRFIIILGAVILGMFISISMIGFADKDDYNQSTNIIENISYNDGKMIVTARKDMQAVCAKQTKTTPEADALCWVDTIDSVATMSIYEYKTYYIWVKDYDGVITYYSKYNANTNN